MPKISFLGSCREVGRSAILIESNSGDQCLLDYGIRFRGEERIPYETDLGNLKAVALTHCHIDHSGALPILYKERSIPFYTNPLSLRIIETLIKDMIRISNYPFPFGFRELRKVISNAIFLENKFRQKIADNFYITFFNAGHIPGSVSILVEVNNKKILYSGDINTKETMLTSPANPIDIPELDALIIESTYALRNHPPREDLEKSFVENITAITENGGRVLIPAFGVARSQEALLILNKYNYTGKIFIDGLAKEICDVYLLNQEFLRDGVSFRRALKKAQYISAKDRNTAKKSNGVIIAPSGMLKGGAAISFTTSILKDPASAIYLIGYQVEGSPGRILLDKGIFKYRVKDKKTNMIKRIKMNVKCEYNYFDFSSHADGIGLHKFINNLGFLNDSKVTFCVHGDSKSTTTFASELVKNNYSAISPEIGETYKI